MTGPQILLSVVLGLLINECCDISPWMAHRLVRWAARHRYVRRERAEVRAEELSALINDLPGKVVKLVTAVSFATVAAAVCVGRAFWRRTPSRIRRLARQVARRKPAVASSLLDARVVVMDTSERGVEALETMRDDGFINDLECNWVAGACWSLDNELRLRGESATVSVLTYYRAQAVAIRRLLDSISPHLRGVRLQLVGTIGEAQGQESDFVIVSFSRTSRSIPNPRFGGFLQDVRRLNVVLTRARRTLVLVGHVPTLRKLGGPDSDFANVLTRVIDSDQVPIIRNRHWIIPGDAGQVWANPPD